MSDVLGEELEKNRSINFFVMVCVCVCVCGCVSACFDDHFILTCDLGEEGLCKYMGGSAPVGLAKDDAECVDVSDTAP